MSNVLKGLPSVSELLDSPPLKSLVSRVSQSTVVSGVRRFLDQVRSEVPTASQVSSSASDLADRIARWISNQQQSPVASAINGTGILLATHLDGPPLADEAVQAMADMAIAYASKPREASSFPREAAFSKLAARLTACEAAMATNSSTSAVLLAVQAIAKGKEVVVARGDLTETAEQSRWLDVLTAGGVKLREVGAANLVRIADFAGAITAETGAVLRLDAHASRSSEPSIAELSALARERKVPLIQFMGVAGIANVDAYSAAGLLTASQSIAAGTDVVVLAGDGLLGGPRAGLILGKKSLIQQVASHPLAPALAIDRLNATALLSTLELHLDPQQMEFRVPIISLLATPLDNLRNRSERLAAQMNIPGVLEAFSMPFDARLTAPGVGPAIPSFGILLRGVSMSSAQLEEKLAHLLPAIFVGKTETGLTINLRTVLPRQDIALVTAIDGLRPVDASAPQDGGKPVSGEVSPPKNDAGELPTPDVV